MKERSSIHQEASSSPSHVFRKTKTSEGSSATASGLNTSFTHVPTSGGAIQRAAMEEGGEGGGSVFLSADALAMLPDDAIASLGSALGGEAGEIVHSRGKRGTKNTRQVFSNDIENPRHVVDRSESDKTGFDTKGVTHDPKGPEETAGSIRLQAPSTTNDPDDFR